MKHRGVGAGFEYWEVYDETEAAGGIGEGLAPFAEGFESTKNR